MTEIIVLAVLLLVIDALAFIGARRAAGAHCGREQPILVAVVAALLLTSAAATVFAFAAGRMAPAGAAVDTFLAFLVVFYLPKAMLAVAAVAELGITAAGSLASAALVREPLRRRSARERLSRGRWLTLPAGLLAAATTILLAATALHGGGDPEVRRVSAAIPGLPRDLEGLRILHLSDLHAAWLARHPALAARTVALANAERADLVVYTGDLGTPAEASAAPEVLGRIAAPLGRFAVLGNHDLGSAEHAHDNWQDESGKRALIEELRELLARQGTRLLVNELTRVARGEAGLELYGTAIQDPHHGYRDADLAPLEPPPGAGWLRILLTHSPDLWGDAVAGRLAAPLTLAGHTHGGQLGLELGPLRLSPAMLMFRRWAGPYREGGQLLYVNRGLGCFGVPFRAGVAPELTVITLAGADSEAAWSAGHGPA